MSRAKVIATGIALMLMMTITACSSTDAEQQADDAPVLGPSVAETESSAAVAEWLVPQDVLTALEARGFACEWSGQGDQILDENPTTGDKAEIPIVRCDEYGVALGSGEPGWYAGILPECQPLTDADRESELSSAQIVLGPNFAILGAAEGASFPQDAQADDFVDAFGGEIITFLDLYERVCGDEQE